MSASLYAGMGAPKLSPRPPQVEHVAEVEIQNALSELDELTRKGMKFGNAAMRVVGRQIASSGGSAPRMHRAVAYLVDAIYSHGVTAHRLLYRVESAGGRAVFVAASGARGSVHEAVFAAEGRLFADGPYTWTMYKNVLKKKGATDLAPRDFLLAAQRAVAREEPGRGGAGGGAGGDLVERLWCGELRLREPRQMIDKVKYVKDWGDLGQSVEVRITLSSSGLEHRIERAREELLAASPRASPRPSSDSSFEAAALPTATSSPALARASSSSAGRPSALNAAPPQLSVTGHY